MPKAEIARRGGAVRVRRIKLSDDRYANVYVVRKAGKRGGHTVMGEPHAKEGPPSSKVKADTQPAYKMKPNTGRKQVGNVKKAVARRRG